MKTTAHTEPSQTSDAAGNGAQPNPAYNVLIVYDEFASGRHAVEACARLVSELRDKVSIRVKMWSFGLLRNTAASLTAATDAAKAQMVVIATSREDLPSAVKKWIEVWLVLNGRQGGLLVGLLTAPESTDDYCPAETYLRTAAANAGMEFLLETTHHPEESGRFCPP